MFLVIVFLLLTNRIGIFYLNNLKFVFNEAIVTKNSAIKVYDFFARFIDLDCLTNT